MIVIDCSAVVDALSGLKGTDDLLARIDTEELHAPTLIDIEVVSALRGLTRGRQLSPDRAMDLLSDFDDLPLHRWACADGLRRRSFALRDNLSAYDAMYVALAESVECPLVTRDARLARSSGHDARIEVW